MDPNAHATFVVDAVVDETNDITIPSMPFTVECTAVETPGKGNIVFPFTLQSIMQPSISKFCLYVVQAYSCEHLSSSSFLIMMLAIIRKIIMILAIILISTLPHSFSSSNTPKSSPSLSFSHSFFLTLSFSLSLSPSFHLSRPPPLPLSRSDYVDGYCGEEGPGIFSASIVTSGLNNVTLRAAETLSGRTFDSTTIVKINGTACTGLRVASDGRSLQFITPPIEIVGEGFNEITISNSAGPGTVCWGEHCEHDRCTTASGALCPALPPKQRGVYFTGICAGFNRLGVEFPPSTDPRCISTAVRHELPPAFPLHTVLLTYNQLLLLTNISFFYPLPPQLSTAADACSWGWGGTCRQCPLGCRCPGGPRCWVLPGYWIDSIASPGNPIACEPAAEAKLKCLGFDLATGASSCGLNHDGYLCTGCIQGYYRSLGDCEKCPSSELLLAVRTPFMFFVNSYCLYYCCNRRRVFISP